MIKKVRMHFFKRDRSKLSLDERLTHDIVWADKPEGVRYPKSFGSIKEAALYFLRLRNPDGTSRLSYDKIAIAMDYYFPGAEIMPGRLNWFVRQCRRGVKGYNCDMSHRREVRLKAFAFK